MSLLVFLEWDQCGINEYVGVWEFLGCEPVVSRICECAVSPHKCGPGVLLVRSVWH